MYAKSKHVTGFWVQQSNEQPSIDYTQGVTGAHSLGQLWAIDRHGESCMSDVEIGWTVSKAQYGDIEPHLFIFHVGPDLLIDSVTAYWNDAAISQQLGHNEVD